MQDFFKMITFLEYITPESISEQVDKIVNDIGEKIKKSPLKKKNKQNFWYRYLINLDYNLSIPIIIDFDDYLDIIYEHGLRQGNYYNELSEYYLLLNVPQDIHMIYDDKKILELKKRIIHSIENNLEKIQSLRKTFQRERKLEVKLKREQKLEIRFNQEDKNLNLQQYFDKYQNQEINIKIYNILNNIDSKNIEHRYGSIKDTLRLSKPITLEIHINKEHDDNLYQKKIELYLKDHPYIVNGKCHNGWGEGEGGSRVLHTLIKIYWNFNPSLYTNSMFKKLKQDTYNAILHEIGHSADEERFNKRQLDKYNDGYHVLADKAKSNNSSIDYLKIEQETNAWVHALTIRYHNSRNKESLTYDKLIKITMLPMFAKYCLEDQSIKQLVLDKLNQRGIKLS